MKIWIWKLKDSINKKQDTINELRKFYEGEKERRGEFMEEQWQEQ